MDFNIFKIGNRHSVFSEKQIIDKKRDALSRVLAVIRLVDDKEISPAQKAMFVRMDPFKMTANKVNEIFSNLKQAIKK